MNKRNFSLQKKEKKEDRRGKGRNNYFKYKLPVFVSKPVVP